MTDLESRQKSLAMDLNMNLENAKDALSMMISDLTRTKEELEKLMKEGAVNGAITESSIAAGQSSVFGTYTKAMTRARCLQQFYWQLESLKEK